MNQLIYDPDPMADQKLAILDFIRECHDAAEWLTDFTQENRILDEMFDECEAVVGRLTLITVRLRVHDIAREFDRLFAHDPSIVGPSTGHLGRVYGDKVAGIDWFCEASRHAIMDIAIEDLQRAGKALQAMDRADFIDDIEQAFDRAAIRYKRVS